MMPQKSVALLDKLIDEMASALVVRATDLGDERQVLRALVAEGYSEGDIVGLSDQVIATARAKQNHQTKGIKQ